MLTSATLSKGFTLVELAIGMALLAIILGVGLPSFSLWIQNTQIRTAAESVLNGLQLARAEAVSRNANVRFQLTDTQGSIAWTVGCVTPVGDTNGDGMDDCPAIIQSRANNEGSANARTGISTAANAAASVNTPLTSGAGLPAGVTFTFLGRVPTANAGTDITRVDVISAKTIAGSRRMTILIGAGGTTRMCDPAVALAVNPQGCI